MRKIGLALVLLALAVGFGISADAAPQDSLVADLYVGEVHQIEFPGDDWVHTRVRLPTTGLTVIGSVTFTLMKNGEVKVSVKVNDSDSPNMLFRVDLVPATRTKIWRGFMGGLQTNSKGKGSLQSMELPDDDLIVDPEHVQIKISMYNHHDEVYYATELLTIDLS